MLRRVVRSALTPHRSYLTNKKFDAAAGAMSSKMLPAVIASKSTSDDLAAQKDKLDEEFDQVGAASKATATAIVTATAIAIAASSKWSLDCSPVRLEPYSPAHHS